MGTNEISLRMSVCVIVLVEILYLQCSTNSLEFELKFLFLVKLRLHTRGFSSLLAKMVILQTPT